MEKVIKGYKGKYVVDDSGNIISYAYGKQRKLKPQRASQSKKGYYQVRLFSEEYHMGRLQYVHRLVWETFKGKIGEGKEIDHIDGDTTNNSIDNLQVLSPRDNKLKYYKGKDILWREHRDEFIKHYEKLGTYKKVAEVFGIHPNIVYRVIKNVVHRKDWNTGKYITVKYDKNITDYYTENTQYTKRKRDDKGRFTKED